MHTIFKEHLKKPPEKVSPKAQSEWVDNIEILLKEVKFLRPSQNFFIAFFEGPRKGVKTEEKSGFYRPSRP
jgi:hypothetical protein